MNNDKFLLVCEAIDETGGGPNRFKRFWNEFEIIKVRSKIRKLVMAFRIWLWPSYLWSDAVDAIILLSRFGTRKNENYKIELEKLLRDAADGKFKSGKEFNNARQKIMDKYGLVKQRIYDNKKYFECIKILNESTLPVPENWDIYEVGPETPNRTKSGNKYLWVFYEGGNDWEAGFRYQAVYAQAKYDHQGEMSRIWIEVKYPPEIADKGASGTSEDIKKLQNQFGKVIADKWISTTKKLRALHASENSEWHRIMDEENKKLDAARDKGLDYDRNIPDIPKNDGNWADAFIEALKDKELKGNIKRFGIDRTNWKEAGDFIYNQHEIQKVRKDDE